MSCYCECPQCGGNDEMAMCENGYLRAQIAAGKSAKVGDFLLWLSASVFLVCVLFTNLGLMVETIKSLTTDSF
ncbi:hypothetical protein DV532_29340 (plasmid) [Pseudomonas sp. Leaf58]|nr:hypothetical protein DV532_29340 [Pseudomonas sp. Leaf58]KQN62104.1 hypothetical protein ASF02_07950 [Pseudomonas sp. Leaf58]